MNVYEDKIIKEMERLKETEPDLQYEISHSQFMKQRSNKRDKLIESVLKYIKKKTLPDINTLCVHKTDLDLYIVVGTHGSMLTNNNTFLMNTITIPKNLGVYRIPQTQYGVYSYTDMNYKKYVYDLLLHQTEQMPQSRSKNVSMSKTRSKSNTYNILRFLQKLQYEMFDFNDSVQYNTIAQKNNFTDKRFAHFKQYTKDHIPEISYFKGDDVIMDKILIVKAHVENGQLIMNDKIYIVHNGYTFTESINLLDYILPFLYSYKNNILSLKYKLSDIMEFIQYSKIKSLIITDLSCSNGNYEDTFNIIENAERMEQKQVLPEKLAERRNKNYQWAKGEINVIPQHKAVPLSKSRRLANKHTVHHTRKKTGQRSYFNKNEMFYPHINILEK
jgi:hypothetical protein